MTTVAALAALPVFESFTTQELEVLIGVAEHRRFLAGGVLCREGAAASSCFIVVAGEVEISKESGAGPRVISKLGPGALIGQIALVDRRPRSATVRALKDTTALELPRDVFDRLLSAQSPFAHRFQEHVAIAAIRQLRAATTRLATQLAARSAATTNDAKAVSALHGVRVMLEEWSVSDADLDEVDFVAPESLPRSMHSRRGR